MTIVKVRPLPLADRGLFQPFHIGEFPAIVNGDRFEHLAEERAEPPFYTVKCLYSAFFRPIRHTLYNFLPRLPLRQHKKGFF